MPDIAAGSEAALAVYLPYFEARNDKGEPVCVLQPLRGAVGIAESTYIGESMVNGKPLLYWAVHFGGRGGDYWMLWSEPSPDPDVPVMPEANFPAFWKPGDLTGPV